jgi:hypothetical protein
VNSGIFETLLNNDKWSIKFNLNGGLFNLMTTATTNSFSFTRIVVNSNFTIIQGVTLSNTPSFYFTTMTNDDVAIDNRVSQQIGTEQTFVICI